MKTSKHGQYLTKMTQYWSMNAYLVEEEDGLTLIDTLMGGQAEGILDAAAALGKPIRRIALTHAHVDHIGSLDALRAKLPDAEILIGEREARLMGGRDLSLDPDEPQAEPKGGFPAVTSEPTRTLNEDDLVGSLRVINTPGHTPGHISFFDTRDKTLIAGDALQTLGGVAVAGKFKLLFPLPAFATWHKPTALASARKLRHAEPSRLAAGHGGVVENPIAQMDKALEAAARAFADY